MSKKGHTEEQIIAVLAAGAGRRAGGRYLPQGGDPVKRLTACGRVSTPPWR
jgi:hypothetical protein